MNFFLCCPKTIADTFAISLFPTDAKIFLLTKDFFRYIKHSSGGVYQLEDVAFLFKYIFIMDRCINMYLYACERVYNKTIFLLNSYCIYDLFLMKLACRFLITCSFLYVQLKRKIFTLHSTIESRKTGISLFTSRTILHTVIVWYYFSFFYI